MKNKPIIITISNFNEKELDYIRATTEKQMYINDLNNLRKELEKEFK